MKKQKYLSIIALILIGSIILIVGGACASAEEISGETGSCIGHCVGCIAGAFCTGCVDCMTGCVDVIETRTPEEAE